MFYFLFPQLNAFVSSAANNLNFFVLEVSSEFSCKKKKTPINSRRPSIYSRGHFNGSYQTLNAHNLKLDKQ